MQTIIKFLANGGKVHVSFVTFFHFLDIVSFELIADWPISAIQRNAMQSKLATVNSVTRHEIQ